MGNPPKQKRKYQRPSHPWQKKRIEEEKDLVKGYGLKNKREVWKARATIKRARQQAKKLFILDTPQGERERTELVSRLSRYGILKEKSTLDDVLALTVSDVLERRLQTLVAKKGISKSYKQARQFITHGHIALGEERVTSPGKIVSKEEETKLSFYSKPISLEARPPKPKAAPPAEPAPGEAPQGDVNNA